MNRSLITGLTLASVAGSGGAFAAVAAASQDAPPAATQAPTPIVASAFVQPAQTIPSSTFSYQVGTAGTVTLTATNGSLTIDDTAVGAGWTLASATGPGTHVEVQYSDTMQLVTFGADLVNSNIVVSVTNVAAPGSLTTAAPEPITVVKKSNPVHNTTAQPQPATPQTTAAPAAAQPSAATAAPTTAQPPSQAATTAPSGSGTTDDQNDDNERESNDD